ncbi:Rieske 2Fe-2S domain-containing protein [Burkholderia multivorans]|nr:Rieske 2Fe-2S domain-containing protein [Burkholderia multivorans]UQP90416.1 Rieske 2Fe-2S domain-containing protein [Burkholderia multivorans]
MFLKNAWYVACTPDEFASKPLGRQICGERMVFFRDGEARSPRSRISARIAARRCRSAPCANGHLVCGYHGLTMGADGKCTSMPCQRVGGIPAIRRYPAVERYGFVWVWPGDPAQADPATIHPLHWADDPGWAYGGGLYHIDCDYRLMIDNLMDLTHETYVHASSIGSRRSRKRRRRRKSTATR